MQRLTGHLVDSFTNTITGKSIVENISGPATVTTYPDGSLLIDGQGQGFLDLDPVSQANTGEPGLVFATGHTVALFDPSGRIQSLTLTGRQTDGCALLS